MPVKIYGRTDQNNFVGVILLYLHPYFLRGVGKITFCCPSLNLPHRLNFEIIGIYAVSPVMQCSTNTLPRGAYVSGAILHRLLST